MGIGVVYGSICTSLLYCIAGFFGGRKHSQISCFCSDHAGIGYGHHNMPSTDDGPVRSFPAYSFHFTKAGWSSMDGCTSFDYHGCQNVKTQVVAIDLSSMAGWTNLYLCKQVTYNYFTPKQKAQIAKRAAERGMTAIAMDSLIFLIPVLSCSYSQTTKSHCSISGNSRCSELANPQIFSQ